MKTLYLTLKKKWFDMILYGLKDSEYRDYKPYWEVRLGKVVDSEFVPFKFDKIVFRNGYTKNAREMEVQHVDTISGIGILELGASGKTQFIIQLGEIIKIKNIKQLKNENN